MNNEDTNTSLPQTSSTPIEPNKNRSEVVILLVFVLALLVVTGSFLLLSEEDMLNQDVGNTQNKSITNFDECKNAGYPIMESFPEQCSANGQTFVNDTSTENTQ